VKHAFGLLLFSASLVAGAAPGWSIRRVPDMPDGAPAFEVLSPQSQVTTRIECINNGWYDADGMAVRLLGSSALMAAIQAKEGRLALDDLGPAKFDCVVADPAATGRAGSAAPRLATERYRARRPPRTVTLLQPEAARP
jgi:hypothetical protein